MDRIRIGFWESNEEPNLPHPKDFIDATWNEEERKKVIAYLDAGKEGKAMKGWSTCRICKIRNGSCDLYDDTYIWPQGFAHYLEAHDVKPPIEFIKHALKY